MKIIFRRNKFNSIIKSPMFENKMAIVINHPWQILLGVLFIWLLIIIFISGPLLRRSDTDYNMVNIENAELIMARLSRAFSEIDSLRSHNEELRSFLNEFLPLNQSDHSSTQINRASCSQEASKQFEGVRRRLIFNYNELWYYVNTVIKNASKNKFINEHRGNFLYDLGKFSF